MLLPRVFAVAVATCAAAPLPGPSVVPDGGAASVDAAGRLACHCVLDARAALNVDGSSRRTRRLLARADRRLGYAYALTAALLNDHAPAALAAAATFSHAASQVACHSATLARRADGPLQAFAVRSLRRASQREDEVAFELTTGRSTGSIEDLIAALFTALQAQDALLAALDATAGSPSVPARRRSALQASATRALAARCAVRDALANARDAMEDLAAQQPSAGERSAPIRTDRRTS